MRKSSHLLRRDFQILGIRGHKKRSRKRSSVALAAWGVVAGAGMSALLGQSADAASQAWNGGSTNDGNWSDVANWVGGAAPGSTSVLTSTDIATFNALIGTNGWGSALTPVIIDQTTQDIGGITFTTASDNYFIGTTTGNSLFLTSGGLITMTGLTNAANAVVTDTVNAPLVIEGASYTFQNNSANGVVADAGIMDFGGAISGGAAGTTVLTLAGSNTNANTISGVIGNGSATTFGLTKSGAGIWILSNTETYSGPTTISAGNLTLAGYQASAASSAFTVTGSGTLVAGAATLAINSGSGTPAASVTRGSSLTLNNGSLTLTGTTATTDDVFTGALSVGSGPSALFLSPNASGNLQLTFGSLASHTPGSLLTLPQVNAAATSFGGTPAAGMANLFFSTPPSGSNFIGGGGASNTATASIIPWMHSGSNATTLYTYNTSNGVTPLTVFSNSLSGTSQNNVLLTANTTLTGATTVNALDTAGDSVAMAGNTLTVTSGVLCAGVNSTIGSDASSSNWGTVAFGSAEAVLSAVQARTLVINSVITGTGGLTFAGYYMASSHAGYLVLNGANTYSGVTNFYDVGGGSPGATVYLSNALALQNSTLNYVAGYNAGITFGPTVAGTTAPTAYTFGGLTGTANITLANNNTTAQPITLTLGNDGLNDVYSGNLLNGAGGAAGGSLIFNGTGSETLLGTGNTYTGGTSVRNGTLILGHGGVLAATNTITLGSGANSGTFQLGDSTAAVNTTVTNLQTSGTGTANAVVGGNSAVSTLTVNIASGSQAYSGILGGSGTNQNNLGLTKTGAGIFTLSGTNNSYTGPTMVSAGTLTVSGKLNGLSAVSVSGGATLNGYGSIAGMVTLAGGTSSATQGSVNLQDAMTSTLSLGGLTVGGATGGQVSNLDFDLGNGTVTNDQINLGLNAFIGNTGGAVINVDQLGTLAQGTYTLMTYGSDSGLTVGTNLTLNAPQHFGTNYALNLGSSSLTLTVSGTPAPNVAYWSGVQGGSYNWGDHGSTTTNWDTTQTGSTDTGAAPGSNTDVVFANSGATSASLTTQLETTYSINSLTILGTSQTSATTGTVTTIGGTGALNLMAGASGSGSLGYSAGTGIVIGAGSAGLTISTSGGVGVTASQSWTNNSSSQFAVSSNISGSTIASTPVTLTLANSGSGGTTISGLIADGSGLASPVSVVINNPGSGITTLSGSNTYSGSTNLAAGTLDVANSVALQNSTVNDAGVLTFDSGVATHAFQLGALGGSGSISLTDSGSNAVALTAGANNASTGYSGVLSGTGSLTKVGTGTMTLSNANTYSGGTTVSGGTLQLGDGTANNGSVAGGIVDNANVTFANPSPQTFSAVISGTGTVNVSGPGTIILNNTETYTGNTTVSGGTLQLGDGIANDGSIAGNLVNNATVTFANLNPLSYAGTISGSGTLNITGSGGTTLTGANNFLGPIAIASNLTLANTAAATYSGVISGAGTLTVSSSAAVTLSGANNYSGGTFLTSGTIKVTNNTALGTGSLTSSGGALENTSAAAVTLTNPIIATSGTTSLVAVGGDGVLTVNGNISGSGTVAFNYAGSGTIQINDGGNNSGFTGTIGNYAGNTGIRLKFTTASAGSASANFVTVQAGTDTTGLTFGNGTIQFGSLSGNGYIRQDAGGGTTSTLMIGALNSSTTFTGTLTQGTGSTLAVTKVGSGALNLGGTNGYGGPTTVSGGTLQITGTAPGGSYIVGDTLANNAAILDVSGAVTQPYPVSAAQSISGFGTVIGNVSLSGTVNPGTVGVNGSYGTLTIQGLATQTNSNLTFDLGTGAGPEITTGDVLILEGSGTNSIANGTLLTFAGSAPVGGDDYRLIGDDSSGAVVDGFTLSNFTLPTPATGQTYALNTSVDPGYIDLVVTGNAGPANLTFTGSFGNGNWDINSTTNWTAGSGAVVYNDGDNVTFNDTNNGQYNITLTAGPGTATNAGSVSPTSVIVNTAAPNIYTFGGVGIAGTGTLTKTGTGTLVLNNANTYSGATNINQGTVILGITGSMADSAVTVGNGTTAGTLTIAANTSATAGFLAQIFTSLSITSTGTVSLQNAVASSGPNVNTNRTVLSTPSLTITPGGTLNLGSNDMLVHSGVNGESVAATITGEVASGRGTNGLWAGTGITSSAAAASPSTMALAVVIDDTNQSGTLSGTPLVAAASPFNHGLTTFDGQSVADGDVLVKYTYYGDALLTGSVISGDYLQIDNGFNSGGTLKGWYNGDFNYDGVINGDDYTLIDNAYNTQGTVSFAGVSAGPAEMIANNTSQIAEPSSSTVPEPGTLSVVGIGATGLLLRRRRRTPR